MSTMGTLRAPLSPNHTWKGWFNEVADWGSSAAGIKNGILKPTYHVIDWMKWAKLPVSPELMQVRNATKEAKNLMAIGDVPSKINKIWKNFVAMVWGAYDTEAKDKKDKEMKDGFFLAVLDVVSPVCDLADWFSSRVSSLPPSTMAVLSKVNAGALLINMTKCTWENFGKLADGIDALYAPDASVDKVEKAHGVILRTVIDLIKTISYVALAVIALLSSVFVIASAGTYILICSTIATAFTIVGEFTRRALPPPPEGRSSSRLL